MPLPSSLFCGPAGWTHPHWDALVYPQPRPRGFHSLEFLAEAFSAVEISSTFREWLRPEVARLWMKKVSANRDFQFTAKLHRRFTHDRILEKAEIAAYKDGLAPLLGAGKLGCVLMQFPWSFRYTEENREFFIQLRRTFREFPLVAEMRHSSWMRDEALGTFIDYRVGFCNIDQPTYTKAMPPTAFLTSSIGYVRLHGRNCFNWYQDNADPARVHRYDYLYSESELAEWKTRIDRFRQHAAKTFVVTNNDAGGKAIVNAIQLQSMLNPQGPPAPKELLRKFPLELAQYHRPAQTSLFVEYAGRAVA
jgi:uncharacterized protein YecE (DUF72 family)